MDKDRSLQKITPPKSVEKLIRYDVLAKRGLRDLGIKTSDDKFAKELEKLVAKFFDQIRFRKLKNKELAKFSATDAKIYLEKLNKLVDKAIDVCQESLKNIRLNSPLRCPTLLFLGFLLMSKKDYQEAIAAFRECLSFKQGNRYLNLLLWSGESELVEGPVNEESLLEYSLRDKKVIPTSKDFRKLSAEVWDRFGKRYHACISTLAGDCFLKIDDRENALTHYQKSIDFLAKIFTASRPRTPIWRESHTYLREIYDEIIDFLHKWKGLQAVDEFIHKNKNQYAPSDGDWLSYLFPNEFFPDSDQNQDSSRFDNFDDSKIDEYLQIKKYSKKELIGYAIGIYYYELDDLKVRDIKETRDYALEIIQSLKNIYPQDNEIDFIYGKMLNR